MSALDLIYDGPAKFYTYSQQAVFLNLLRYFDRQDIKYTLRDVLAIFRDLDLVKEISGEEVNPGHLKGLSAALTPYADISQINDHEADINLAQVMEAGDVVYFDLRSAVAPELAAGLGKMIAMDLQVHAAFRTQRDKIVLVAIDEFQNKTCPAFRNVISKVRDANYALVLSNQGPGDLRAVSKDFLETIGINTRTKIVFSVDNPYDVENYAKRSGNVLIRVESESQSKSRPAGQLIGGHSTEGKSIQEQEKSMINANQLLLLPFGKSAIYRRGKLATLANHTHLISKEEKDHLIQEPYPEPEPRSVLKQGIRTASKEIERMKLIIIEKKKREKKGKDQEKQEQNQAQGQPRQQPSQGENAGVETEDIAM